MPGCKWNLHDETYPNATFSAICENGIAFGYARKIFVEIG
jgi:hypothetical protein